MLIEALFATLFLGIFSLIIAYYQGNVIYTQHESLRKLQAISRASQIIDTIIMKSKFPKNVKNKPNSIFFTSIKQLPSPLAGFLPFSVTVSWNSQSGGKKEVTLYSGMITNVQKSR